MKVFLLGLGCWLFSLSVLAQGTHAHLEERLVAFLEYARAGRNVSDSVKLAQALQLKDSIVVAGHTDLLADMYALTARLHRQLGRMGRAELDCKQAIALGYQSQDSLWVADMWDVLGDLYTLEKRSINALDCQFRALQLRERYDTSQVSIPLSYHGVARAYIQIGKYPEAATYLDKAIALKKTLGDTTQMGAFHILYADIYRLTGEYAKAEANYLRYVRKRLKQKNYDGLYIIYEGLAETYLAWGKTDKAEEYYLLALDAAQKQNRQRNMGIMLLNLGALYKKTGRQADAERAFQDALAATSNVDSRVYQLSAYHNLYQLHKDRGNIGQALANLEAYATLQDTFRTETVNAQVDNYKASLDLEQRERELAALDAENKKGKRERNLLLLGLGLLSVMLLTLVHLYRSRNTVLKNLTQEQAQTSALLREKEELLDNLQQTNLQLIQADKMASIGLMTAGIAHELNNPVSAISAAVDALKMDYDDLKPLLDAWVAFQQQSPEHPVQWPQVQQQYADLDVPYIATELGHLLQTISNGTQRASDIVRGLRVFSRDTHDEALPYRPEEGLDTALTLLGHKMTPQIVIHKDYRFQDEIICQAGRINQVFLNVLDNAVQALDGQGNIWIGTEKADTYCRITIRDDGAGMDESTRQKLFEPFYTTKAVGQGTGLGMFISYAIVQQHGGSIGVESVVGEGSRFDILIPLV